MPPNKNSLIRVRNPLVALLWIFGYLYLMGIGAFIAMILGGLPFSPFLNGLLPVLGLPWNLLAGRLPRILILDSSLTFWAQAFAPAINFLILYLLMRLMRRSEVKS